MVFGIRARVSVRVFVGMCDAVVIHLDIFPHFIQNNTLTYMHNTSMMLPGWLAFIHIYGKFLGYQMNYMRINKVFIKFCNFNLQFITSEFFMEHLKTFDSL